MKPRNTPLVLTGSAFEDLTEGDCACSSSFAEVSLPDALIQNGLAISSGLIQRKLDNDFQVFLSPNSSKGAAVLNNAAIEVLNDFDAHITSVDAPIDCDLDELVWRFFSQGLVKLTGENQAANLSLMRLIRLLLGCI